ncbi:hypothetical protein ACIPQA_33605 [Streptomyces sp. NPDC090109]|uniref:hypothetical protein n=1 Tax=Streptomyces sp. NPDC090109 TaxID=3365948 RepID=UPI0037F3DA43
MSATAINWIVAAGSALTALGILGAAVRRTVRALIDGVRVVRQLLELQPRVVELGERLVVLVEQQSGHGARLDRLETAVFPLTKESRNAP